MGEKEKKREGKRDTVVHEQGHQTARGQQKHSTATRLSIANTRDKSPCITPQPCWVEGFFPSPPGRAARGPTQGFDP